MIIINSNNESTKLKELIDKLKGIKDDENIIVMPEGLFSEENFHKYTEILNSELNANSESIILMGQEAQLVSEKHGYITPESGFENSHKSVKVKEFKEKPATERALGLVMGRALWNCYVYAMKSEYFQTHVADKQEDFPEVTFEKQILEGNPDLRVVFMSDKL